MIIMTQHPDPVSAKILKEAIINGIIKKKGKQILSLGFSNIPNSICDFFVICHGNSKVQAEAIADGIQEEVKMAIGIRPWNKEGVENGEWILLDYVDVVVHIFQEPVRTFYHLEGLWADAEREEYPYQE